MTERTLHPAKKISAAAMEKLCNSLKLTLTMKGSLKSIAENIHWHYKRGNEKGVLEITLLPATNEVILSCKKNRSADWVEEVIKELEEHLLKR